MNAIPPTPFTYDASRSVMVPLRPRQADKTFVDGRRYLLEISEERSSGRHRAFFAELREAWMSLPDHLAERYPSPEKLRKEALIRKGWCDTQRLVLSSRKAAQDVAAFMRPSDDEIVEVRDCVVTRYVARSQAVRAMNREDFNASADDVLDYVASLIGVSRKQLEGAESA